MLFQFQCLITAAQLRQENQHLDDLAENLVASVLPLEFRLQTFLRFTIFAEFHYMSLYFQNIISICVYHLILKKR